ncbi:hypothetical protein KGF56_004232 [Candida oxycetoniae]|uniref:Uncharacterized protein n=1 Tax=Candida oxycetoniae TaxID=497107 RepID=A0AAI9WWQ7_9ASCO|nr:uncharacterized protein KGF56_004232 [Candida oxycetoniae]KAI3402979.2 hypothetical protein KGF56_004232 [Candida oxycetoniae]
MQETIEHLTNRLDRLNELLSNQDEKSTTLTGQIDHLRHRLNGIYQSHRDYAKLETILKELKIANKCSQLESKTGDQLSQDVKEEEIMLYYGDILENYSSMVELENMGYDSLIDKINVIISNSSIEDIRTELKSREEQIRKVHLIYRILVLKNMMIYEKYVASTINMNKFWLHVSQKLATANQELKKRHDKLKEDSRY